jgi:hypothetical protein
MLPAVPCAIPFFTCRALVGQAAGPAGAGDVPVLAVAGTVAGEVAAGALVTVTVAPGAPVVLPLVPQAVTIAATQASAAPAISRRAAGADDVIAVSF